MNTFRYVDGVASLHYDSEKCIGCGNCIKVCPHRVFAMDGRKATLVDYNACMECGACALNCPADAISVDPGVGCAALIIKRWLGMNSTECC